MESNATIAYTIIVNGIPVAARLASGSTLRPNEMRKYTVVADIANIMAGMTEK